MTDHPSQEQDLEAKIEEGVRFIVHESPAPTEAEAEHFLRDFAREIQDFCEHGCEYAQAAEYKAKYLASQQSARSLAVALEKAAERLMLTAGIMPKEIDREATVGWSEEASAILAAYRSERGGEP
jgi:hypothetical protein